MFGPRYYVRVSFYFSFDSVFLLWKKIARKKKETSNAAELRELLIVKLDAAGDYVLFRNFLSSIRHSKRFSGYRITLCGNEMWKDLALDLDSGNVDEFLWINRADFKSSLRYRWSVLSTISDRIYDVVFQPVVSREFLYGDPIVRIAEAKYKIGVRSDTVASSRIAKCISNTFYDELLSPLPRTTFEFLKNRDLVEKFLSEETGLKRPSMEIRDKRKGLALPEEAFAVIFPGAGTKWRRWSSKNFAVVARHLLDAYGLEIAILGGASDLVHANEIRSSLNDAAVHDYCGQLSLADLPYLFSKATLAVVNDTIALHIAISVGCPVVCVSNGNSYLRFVPYPESWNVPARFIFHPTVLNRIERSSKQYVPGSEWSKLDIDKIQPQSVMKAIDEMMSQIEERSDEK